MPKEILISNKNPYSKKTFEYFIGYKDDKKSQTVLYNASKNEWIC